MTRKQIYIAGPDVFLRGAAEYYATVSKLLEDKGFTGVPPSDGGMPLNPLDTKENAFRIYNANIDIINKCDLVLANINEFRGCEPDSGTCFEIGYAVAKGIPVICYIDDDLHYHDRVERRWGSFEDNGNLYDCLHDMHIEKMGLHVNLMIACSSHIEIGLDNAIEHIIRKYA